MALCLRPAVHTACSVRARQHPVCPLIRAGVTRQTVRTTAAFGSKPQPAKALANKQQGVATAAGKSPKGAAKLAVVTPDPSFNLQIALLAISGFAFYENITPVGFVFGLLGVFLTFQATRIRFKFDDEAIELFIGGQESDNIVVGGQNRWNYDTFVNWEFWFPNFPILVYFKETQTKPEGQVHFFPIIFNGKQLYNAMVERCGPSKTSGPK